MAMWEGGEKKNAVISIHRFDLLSWALFALLGDLLFIDFVFGCSANDVPPRVLRSGAAGLRTPLRSQRS